MCTKKQHRDPTYPPGNEWTISHPLEKGSHHQPFASFKGGICHHFLESTPQKSNIDRYLEYCFFQCISFQVWLFWVSMLLFGGVFCQIFYPFIGKIEAIVTFWSGFSTINIQVLHQNAWGSSPQKVALQKRPQRISLIKPSSKNRQNKWLPCTPTIFYPTCNSWKNPGFLNQRTGALIGGSTVWDLGRKRFEKLP